jgi:hypothetical protein
MRDVLTNRLQCPALGKQVCELLDHLDFIVVDSLRHGFFDISIACEIGSGGKRQLVIRAGKSHKFTIPEDEVPR